MLTEITTITDKRPPAFVQLVEGTRALAVVSAPVRSETGGLVTFKKSGLDKAEYRAAKRSYYQENKNLAAALVQSANTGASDIKFSVTKNKLGQATSINLKFVPTQAEDPMEAQLAEANAKLAAMAKKLADLGIE
jgi:hypothetical protein